MKIQNTLTGAAMAAAVALTFVSMPSATFADGAQNYQWVKCYGINDCRGHSACKITSNQCHVINPGKGQNACKGKGFLWKSPENCKLAGGSAPESPERME